jgi:hypothetical protein
VTPEEVTVDYNEQPEPHDKREHRNHIHQEISIGEAFLEEKHRDTPYVMSGGSVFLAQDDRTSAAGRADEKV